MSMMVRPNPKNKTKTYVFGGYKADHGGALALVNAMGAVTYGRGWRLGNVGTIKTAVGDTMEVVIPPATRAVWNTTYLRFLDGTTANAMQIIDSIAADVNNIPVKPEINWKADTETQHEYY